jgi:hypothetical protein
VPLQAHRTRRLRDRYAALTTAAPAMIEHLAEQEEGAPDLFADDDDREQ